MPHGLDRPEVSTVALGAAPGVGDGVGAGVGAGEGVGVTVEPATPLTAEDPPQAVKAPARTVKTSMQHARKGNLACSLSMEILRVGFNMQIIRQTRRNSC